MNKYFIVRLPVLLLLFFQLVPLACTHEPFADLRQGFLNPPDSCRPGMYWYFMDGNLEREAMTQSDFEITESFRKIVFNLFHYITI